MLTQGQRIVYLMLIDSVVCFAFLLLRMPIHLPALPLDIKAKMGPELLAEKVTIGALPAIFRITFDFGLFPILAKLH